MLENSVVHRIVELFDSTCVSQFESMGCSILKVSDPSAWHGLLSAHIEAVSDDLSIELLLIAPGPLLAQTMPSGEGYSVADPDLQKDWLLELANRFVGRLKNKLVEHGSVLKIGFPVANDSDNDKKVFIKNVQGDEILISTNKGRVIRTSVKEIRIAGRNTQGVRLIKLSQENEHLVGLERIDEPSSDELIEGDGLESEGLEAAESDAGENSPGLGESGGEQSNLDESEGS